MTGPDNASPPRPPIKTLDDLKNHLWEACYVEVSTIPLYLYALYSVKSQIDGANAGYVGDVNKSTSASAVTDMSAFRTIRSVVIEEMLHLTHARNVLYSIGGEIAFYDPCFVPRYGVIDEPICTPPAAAPPGAPLQTQTPGQQYMLHRLPPLPFNLARCTLAQVEETFVPLEIPAEGDEPPPQSDWYNSIGQFYAAIQTGFEYLSGEMGPNLFNNNQAAYQLHSVASYWNQEGGGAPLGVTDMDTVQKAIREIVDQGEGATSDLTQITFGAPARYVRNYEYSHYEKFRRVAQTIQNVQADAFSSWASATDTPEAKKQNDEVNAASEAAADAAREAGQSETEIVLAASAAAAAKIAEIGGDGAAATDAAWEAQLWPVENNPRVANYGEPLRSLAEFCNAIYCYALLLIDANYTVALPDPVLQGENPLPQWVYDDPGMKEKWGLTQALLTVMTGVLFPVIDILVRQPVAPGAADHAGPSFEFYAGFQSLATKEDRKQHLLDLCDALVPIYPALGGVGSVRARIVDLPPA